MSKIPSGLLGNQMRARMEDKATIKHVGGLYVGGSTSTTFNGGDDTTEGTTNAKTVKEIYPDSDTQGCPLVAGVNPAFKKMTRIGIADKAITAQHLSNGTIVLSDPNASPQSLDISVSDGVLNFNFSER